MTIHSKTSNYQGLHGYRFINTLCWGMGETFSLDRKMNGEDRRIFLEQLFMKLEGANRGRQR